MLMTMYKWSLRRVSGLNEPHPFMLHGFFNTDAALMTVFQFAEMEYLSNSYTVGITNLSIRQNDSSKI